MLGLSRRAVVSIFVLRKRRGKTKGIQPTRAFFLFFFFYYHILSQVLTVAEYDSSFLGYISFLIGNQLFQFYQFFLSNGT